MDDGEVELSDHVLLSNQGSDFQNSASCTHTHTCNPPGPDAAHTHTCYHTHTQVIASEEENHSNNNKENSSSKPRRSSGNREAVRKYREKKKARTAYLEEEVKKLRMLNQQLARKLQGQAVLESEVLRLRGLLVDLRGKIDNELGDFPFQKEGNTSIVFKEGDCGLQSTGGAVPSLCQTNSPCFHPNAGSSLQANIDGSGQMMVSWGGNCQPAIVDCRANNNVIDNAEGQTLEAVRNLQLSSPSQAE